MKLTPKNSALLLTLFLFCLALPVIAEEKSKGKTQTAPTSLSVYLPDYRVKAGTEPRLFGTTHLILFSAKPDGDGKVDFTKIKPELFAFAKKAQASQPVKVTFCVGGWGKGKQFASAVSSEANRKRFVNDLVDFCEKHDLDGVDLDWEFPKGDREHADFEIFLEQLSSRLHANDRILTIALGYTRPLSKTCWPYIDQINLMSYQPWSVQDYEPWLVESIKRFLEAGAPPEKILLGVGFFAKEKAGKRRAISWRHLADGKLEALPDSDSGFWPVGREACDLRLRLVKEYGLGGVMVWDYGHDSQLDDKSLLRHLSVGLGLMPASNTNK